MLINALLSEAMQKLLWAEATSTTEMIANVCVSTRNNMKSPHELFYGEKPKKLDFLHEFGRIAFVSVRRKINRVQEWIEEDEIETPIEELEIMELKIDNPVEEMENDMKIIENEEIVIPKFIFQLYRSCTE